MIKMQAWADKTPTGWRVTVSGENSKRRTYTVQGGDERAAITEGMRRFEAEIN